MTKTPLRFIGLALSLCLILDSANAAAWRSPAAPSIQTLACQDRFVGEALQPAAYWVAHAFSGFASIKRLRVAAALLAIGGTFYFSTIGSATAKNLSWATLLSVIPALGLMIAGAFAPSSPPGVPPSHAFINQVIIPVSVKIPDSTQFAVEENALDIRHTEDFNGQPVEFHYRIEFGGSVIETARHPLQNKVNILKAPAGPWDENTLLELQYAWRRMTIDSLFNRRFTCGDTLELAAYQNNAVDSLLTDLHRDHRALAAMATASGKTIVAFETLRRLKEQRAAHLASGEDPGVTIFYVNNLQILDDAEKTLHRFFKGQFKSGHIYGGSAMDVDGADIIFATPESLLSEKTDVDGMNARLEAIMQTRKVRNLVSDEVHHLPASTYDRIFSLVRSRFPEANLIGFTATEERSDDQNVLRYFGNKRSVLYTVTDGQHQGYLVDLVPKQLDGDVLKVLKIQSRPDALFNGDKALDKRYRTLALDPKVRFPAVSADYRARMATVLNPLGLFVCFRQGQARKWAELFNEAGIPTVSITSDDRNENQALFDDGKIAYKTGLWPEKSDYRHQAVPRTATSVNMVREGVDIPPVTHIYICTDLDSPLAFVQIIGRGLRPARFKTHLTAVDTVGIQRQRKYKEFMAYLQRTDTTDLSQVITVRRSSPLGKTLGDATTTPSGQQGPAALLDNVDDEDISMPRTLGRAFRSGGIISGLMAQGLDELIAARLGFINNDQITLPRFYDFIRALALELQSPMQEERRLALREMFYPTFRYLKNHLRTLASILAATKAPLAEPHFSIGNYVIEMSPETLMVLERLSDLLLNSSESLTMEQIYTLFDEFERDNMQNIDARAKNLRMLRERFFGLDASAMSQRLLADIPLDAVGGPDADVRAFLINEAKIAGRRGDKKALAIYQAEHPVYDHGRAPHALEMQRNLVRAYVAHRLLKNRLQAMYFDLAPDLFAALLDEWQLNLKAKDMARFYAWLKESMRTYLMLLDHGEHPDLARVRQHIADVLRINRHLTFLASSKPGVRLLQALKDWAGSIRNEKGCPKKSLTALDLQIADDLLAFYEQLSVGREVKSTDVSALNLQVEKIQRYRFQINIRKVGKPLVGSFGVVIDADPLERPVAVLSTESYQSVLCRIDSLEVLYSSLAPDEREEFIRQVLATIVLLIPALTGKLIYIVPEDPASVEGLSDVPSFFADVRRAFLLSSVAEVPYIIGPVRRLTTERDIPWDFTLTDQAIDESRWPPVEDKDIAFIRNLLRGAGRAAGSFTLRGHLGQLSYVRHDGALSGYSKIPHALAALYLAKYNNDQGIGERWTRMQNRLNLVDPLGEGFVPMLSLTTRMQWMLAYYPHRDEVIRIIGQIFDLLNLGDPTTGSTDLQIGLSYLRLIYISEHGESDLETTVVRLFTAIVKLLKSLPAGQTWPSEVQSALSDATTVVLQAVNNYTLHERLTRWALDNARDISELTRVRERIERAAA